MSYPDFTVPLTEIKQPLLQLQQVVSGGDTILFDVQFTDLAAAIAAIGSNVATLVISKASFSDASNCTVPSTLTLWFTGAGTLNQTHTVTINGAIVAPARQIFVGTTNLTISPITNPNVLAAWWGEKNVTVPAPAAAPTISEFSLTNVGSSFTNSTTYLVAYTYLAWNGETGLSPTAAFTAKNNQALFVRPKAATNNNSKYAVAAYIYLSDDGGTTWHRADGPAGFNMSPILLSFADDVGGLGGVPVRYNASGAAPPTAGTTTTSHSGVTVPVPSSAPDITNIDANAANTYYGAYAYLCGDGTESALSSVSSGVAIAQGKGIYFKRNEEPPSGAVAVRVYLGTSSTPANLHLQFTKPLHYVQCEIHDYNSSGAAPSAGTAVSALSNFQQAYDAVMNSGAAGNVVVASAPTPFKCPIILRLKNASGSTVQGMIISGLGGHGGAFDTIAGRLYYTGTQTSSVIGICNSSIDTKWQGVDVRDPSSRLIVGLGSCDFYGGGGFTSRWIDSTFEGGAAGGVGYQIPVQAQIGGGHGTSEQYFHNCSLVGNAWGADLHGNQTGNIYFQGGGFYSGGNSNSMNAGQIRNTGAFMIHIEQTEGGGSVFNSIVHLTADLAHPKDAVFGSIAIDHFFTDAGSAISCFVHVSNIHSGNGAVWIKGADFQSNLSDRFAIYCAAPIRFVVSHTEGARGDCWFNYVHQSPTEYPALTQVGVDAFFGFSGGTYAFKSGTNVDYTQAGLQLLTSAFELRNESGNKSQIQTNAAGDIILSPYAAARVGADLIKTTMATNKLIGRSTAGTGALEELSIGSGLSLSAGTLTASVTGGLNPPSDIDCSANPNYPAGTRGDTYVVTLAGKIGGASGTSVDVGDFVICKTTNAGGTQASVGTSWFVLEHNLLGSLLAANNLSDVANMTTARDNLGIGRGLFKADRNGTQQTGLTAGAFNKVNLTHEAADVDNWFDSSTNYRFTPQVAGWYFFNASCTDDSPSSGESPILTVYKNGAAALKGNYLNSSAGLTLSYYIAQVSGLLHFNGSTDYAELFIYKPTGTTLGGLVELTYFSGYLVRAD